MSSPILIALRNKAKKVLDPDWEVVFPDGLRVQLHAQIFKMRYPMEFGRERGEDARLERRDKALRRLQTDVEMCFLTGIPKIETFAGMIERRSAGIMWLAALRQIPLDAWRIRVVRPLTHSVIEQTGEAFFTYEAGLSVEFPK